MNILVVSATHFEVSPLLNFLNIDATNVGLHLSKNRVNNNNLTVLITGIGMVNTAFMMGKCSAQVYDLIINVGVCGSFEKQFKIGDLVNVTQDTLSELGAEDGNTFLKYDQLGLEGTSVYKNQYHLNKEFLNVLPEVNGITVNTIHGNESSILKVVELYHPIVETMEGAAFFASCAGSFLNYLQIRSISNYVEKRDKSKWNMPLAITNLNAFLIQFLQKISK
jgi:futalosine hydrolase